MIDHPDEADAGERFVKSFTRHEPVPEPGIARAVQLMRRGRLHRYGAGSEPSEVARLEQEFAALLGVRYCLACASGGYAMTTALRAFGVQGGEPVLTNAFTLSPVPGAICAAGGIPLLVETTENLVPDLADLQARLETSGARLLLLSHMRGHMADMDRLQALLAASGVALIEDCAHTMGAAWDGRPSGTFGVAACFSTQSYKHINSGEGGLLTSNDPQLMARAVVLSGSYMFYDQHPAAPAPESFADVRLDMPNCSGRMDELRAAILRPQLHQINDRVKRWNERYDALAASLARIPGVQLPQRPRAEQFVGSSIQFRMPGLDPAACQHLVDDCRSRGVVLKWFGAAEPSGYTSSHHHWRYMPEQTLPRTDEVLRCLFDMRIPLSFDIDDCHLVGRIVAACAAACR